MKSHIIYIKVGDVGGVGKSFVCGRKKYENLHGTKFDSNIVMKYVSKLSIQEVKYGWNP